MNILSFRKTRIRRTRSPEPVPSERDTMLADLREFSLQMRQDPELRRSVFIGAGVIVERPDGTVDFTERYACLRGHYTFA